MAINMEKHVSRLGVPTSVHHTKHFESQCNEMYTRPARSKATSLEKNLSSALNGKLFDELKHNASMALFLLTNELSTGDHQTHDDEHKETDSDDGDDRDVDWFGHMVHLPFQGFICESSLPMGKLAMNENVTRRILPMYPCSH